MNVPRIPPPLARQIDRLARRAHAFHRFAHHPLCGRYRGELLRLGRRTRVCKGCTLVATGLAAGVLVGAVTQPPVACLALTWPLALALGMSSLRLRLPKAVGRFVPAFLLAFAAFSGLGPLVLSLGIFVLAAFLYRRRGVERSLCRICPERTLSPCSGFAPIVRRERAFRRRVDRWLDTFPTQPRP